MCVVVKINRIRIECATPPLLLRSMVLESIEAQ